MLHPSNLNLSIPLAAASAFLISSCGNVINDYFDFQIDRINRPARPLPSGDISKTNALIYFVILNILGLFSASLVNTQFLILATINSGISLGYAWKLKRMPLIGNIAVAWLASTTFLAGGLTAASLNEVIHSPIVFLTAIAFFVTLGREIYKDLEDMRGDRACGAATTPITIGASLSVKIANMVILVGLGFAVAPYLINVFGDFYLAALVPSIIVLMYAMKTDQPKRAQRAIKSGMFLGTFAFVTGTFF